MDIIIKNFKGQEKRRGYKSWPLTYYRAINSWILSVDTRDELLWKVRNSAWKGIHNFISERSNFGYLK